MKYKILQWNPNLFNIVIHFILGRVLMYYNVLNVEIKNQVRKSVIFGSDVVRCQRLQEVSF